MKRFVLALCLFCAIISVACDGGEAPANETAVAVASNIVYSKDSRSGLCFGSVTSRSYYGYNVVSITAVPCEKVEHLLVK